MNPDNMTVLGLQWGDEGKGKVVDFLCRQADIVVRFGGGANAGHTVVTDKGKFVLHLLPSGIIQPHTICYLGSGVVCDPWALLEEINLVRESGIKTDGRIYIDYGTHLVLPQHKAIDRRLETLDSSSAIATTLRGIGPAYADRALRLGIIAGALSDRAYLKRSVENFLLRKKAELQSVGQPELLSAENLFGSLWSIADRMSDLVADVTAELRQAAAMGKKVLFEGAQGSLLDLALGTYPYVTASSTTIGGLFSSLGIPPGMQGQVLGVIKAYATRVGNGPFPTELHDSIGDKLRERGHEFGATTGRPRRTGWLDLAAISRTAFINGVNGIVVTKLDVLDGLDEIKVCIAYRSDGKIHDFPPVNSAFLEKAEPIYETLSGWSADTSNVTDYSSLPAEARSYLEFIQDRLGVKIKYISTGAHSEAMIER